MKSKNDVFFFTLVSVLFILAISIPYLYAIRFGNSDRVFSGFLLNPQDGNSYLAKMYQGWQGNWRFHLPFTPDPGKGAYLFLFYLGLGHLARITGIHLVLMFHIARILSSALLLHFLWDFFKFVIPTARLQKFAFMTAALASGMGWLVLGFGLVTSDFWVAEAYPFLSAYVNPHFPLGLSIVLWIMKIWIEKNLNWRSIVYSSLGTFLLGVINPFGVVILIMVFVGLAIYQLINKKGITQTLGKLMIISLSGLPMLIYYFWVVNIDPVFKIWNDQNVTLSPEIWDFLLSFSPALLLALAGLYFIFRDRGSFSSSRIVMAVWMILGILSVYIPFGLQRRFMMGLFIPVTGLAAYGYEFISSRSQRLSGIVLIIFFSLALPGNLVTLMASISGIQTQNPKIYLSSEEMSALEWIEDNTEADSLIMSSPEMGLFIPAYTGRRVIYGHPYESVNAVESEKMVVDFYSGSFSKTQMDQIIEEYQIDFIMIGPREKKISEADITFEWTGVYQQGGISLYVP